ncbi:MAG: transcription antitermination factor NusB [Bacteroidetes bacterium]|nr:transcription antitermination factor NusB [Bacteroidota bacterium]
MANRHLARSVVLQTLFEWDFNGKEFPENSNEEITLNRNIEEFAPGLKDISFTMGLFDMVMKKYPVIDEIIEKAAPDWPMDKIAIVDRNVLRIGLAELLFGDRAEVPPKVAINEAIELAKTFGGEKSGKFVNGVLGAVYKELGEPDRDQAGRKRTNTASVEVDPDKLPKEQKAGGVIISEKDGESFVGLVHDVFGYWTLAKGGVEKGETSEEGAVREIKEKTGLDGKIIKLLGENEYVAFHPEKGKLLKQVSYYLVEAPWQEMSLKSSGGLDDAKWFKLSELENINTYDDILPLLAQAIDYITTKKHD